MNWDVNYIKNQMKERPELFQLLVAFSEIDVMENFSKKETVPTRMIFGKYNSSKIKSISFYKRYSKMLDVK